MERQSWSTHAQSEAAAQAANQQLDRGSAYLKEMEANVAAGVTHIHRAAQDGLTRIEADTERLPLPRQKALARDLGAAEERLEQLQKHAALLEGRSSDPIQARKWALAMMAAAAALVLMGWGWSRHLVASGERELTETSARLERYITLRDEIGLEIRRDNGVVEIALGDVTLRP